MSWFNLSGFFLFFLGRLFHEVVKTQKSKQMSVTAGNLSNTINFHVYNFSNWILFQRKYTISGNFAFWLRSVCPYHILLLFS